MRFYLLSLGCPKNDVDSENLAGFLTADGYERTLDPAKADVLVVNTCGFVRDAKEESIEAVLELARTKRRGQRLVVTGCLYQRYGEELARELPEVDAFVGTGALPAIVQAARGKQREHKQGSVFLAHRGEPRVRLGATHTAFLKAADGCNRRCAFCAIPLFKGRQESRSVESLVTEAESLVTSGARELIVVSQDTTAWGSDLATPTALPALLDALTDVAGYRWLRLLYLYPDRISGALLERFCEHPRLVPYFDIPLQHASDPILQRMARGTSRKQMEAIIARIRARVPGAVLRTSLIVGFPGETDEDVETLMDFLEEQRLDNVGVFAFSEEEGTAAATMDGQIPDEERQSRREAVMNAQAPISAERLAERVGQTLEVLVDGPDEDGSTTGRFHGQAPDVDGVVYLKNTDGGEPAIGSFVRVAVTSSTEYDLFGTMVGEGDA